MESFGGQNQEIYSSLQFHLYPDTLFLKFWN